MADTTTAPKASEGKQQGAPKASEQLPDVDIRALKSKYGEDAKLLSAGKSTIVIEYTETVKDEGGVERSFSRVRKVPRP